MARKPLRPLIRSGGFYPSRKWTPLVYAGGYTTANGGEEPAPPPIEKTVTGNPIHITDALAKPAQALSVKLEPIQDLHGYGSPWPAGGGKNLCLPYTERASHMDVEYTATETGVRVHGTAIGLSYSWGSAYNTYETALIHLPAGTYTFSTSVLPTNSQVTSYLIFNSITEGGTVGQVLLAGNTLSKSVTFSESVGIYYGFYVASGQTVDCECKIMIEAGGTKTTFTPYSNICPISGWTGANVYHSGADTSDATTYYITFPSEAGTVYGGTLDVTAGTLTVTHGNIASYSGETMPGRWISSMDVYSAGGTPTTGAQVVYELATPQTYQLTPTEVTLLLGENNIWSDGEMTLTYLADGNASDVEALNILLGGRYVNNHGEDEPTDREALDILLGR